MHLSLEWFDQQMALDLDNLSPGISERIINTQKIALTQLTTESYATLYLARAFLKPTPFMDEDGNNFCSTRTQLSADGKIFPLIKPP